MREEWWFLATWDPYHLVAPEAVAEVAASDLGQLLSPPASPWLARMDSWLGSRSRGVDEPDYADEAGLEEAQTRTVKACSLEET